MDDVGRPFREEGDGAEVFVVELAEFSGPLDLLLSLIRDEQIDIYNIPIARVAEQFLARIATLNLDEAADYLEMAARLLRIKAQMLLPRREGEDAWDDPRAELVRRLLEYQQVREVVDLLEKLSEERRSRFARAYSPPSAFHPAPPGTVSFSLAELLGAVDRVIRIARRPEMHEVIPRALDVDGAIGLVRAILALRAKAQWTDVVPKDAEPWQVLSFLLALLELAKLGELRLKQRNAFAPMGITRPTPKKPPASSTPRDAASEAA